MEDGELKSPSLHIVNKSSVYLTVRKLCISNTALTSFFCDERTCTQIFVCTKGLLCWLSVTLSVLSCSNLYFCIARQLQKGLSFFFFHCNILDNSEKAFNHQTSDSQMSQIKSHMISNQPRTDRYIHTQCMFLCIYSVQFSRSRYC